MKRIPHALLLAGLLCGFSAVQADELRLYRYTNAEGNLVIEPSIPPEFVRQGYEVINSKGRVLEVVPPAPTAEERMAQREAELRSLAEQQAEQQRKELDQALLSTYSSPEDVMHALNRELEEVDARITVERGNISRISQQKEARQAKAAQLERGGREVPQSLVNEIGQYDTQIARLQLRIEELQQVKQASRLKYIADQRRLERLLAVNQVRLEDWPAELVLETNELSGLWRRRMDDGSQQEWVLNPSGSFTSLREMADGRRQLILGNWTLAEREIQVQINTLHQTDPNGATQILSNPPPRKFPVLDFTGKELVLQVGTDVVRLKR